MFASRLLFLSIAAFCGVASADPCPLVVALEGEPTAVQAIGDQLVARGISTDASTCPGVHTHVERRADQLVIALPGPAGQPVERVVSDPRTAATVIESFVRVDVGSPLLASRAVPTASTRRELPPEPIAAPPVVTPQRTGAHLFGSFDSAVASDRTGWFGMQVGACIMLGPMCPSARFRFDAVVAGGDTWSTTTRNSSELLVGIDLPLAVGSWLVLPGIAVGMGGVRTEGPNGGTGSTVKRETTGLRGELHTTVLVPLTPTLAVDLAVAGVLLQETEVDYGMTLALPRDPLLVFRFGIGLRYGRR